LSSSGVISGTPTGLGGSTFAIKATDSFNPPQETTRTFTLTVTNTLVITTQTLPNAIQNVAYSQQLQATGGVGTLVWLVTGGALPTGLVLSQGGLLQGIPTTISTMTFRATVTDSRGTTSSRDFTLPVDPPLPPFSAPGLPLTVTPTQQVVVNVALAAPYPSTLTGQLNLTFTSNAEVPSDDPMCQFSNGTRTVNFTIPAGTTAAVFPSTVVLITGTVAGTVRLTANIDNGPVDLSVATMEITSTPPKITQASAVKTGSGIDIRITGYSPSRRVTTAEFTFVLRNGNDTQTFTIPRSVDADFAVWYRNPASTTYGSAFSYVPSFIVDPSITIESVTVRLTNAQGSASSVPLKPN
jgi:hypothetical protein